MAAPFALFPPAPARTGYTNVISLGATRPLSSGTRGAKLAPKIMWRRLDWPDFATQPANSPASRFPIPLGGRQGRPHPARRGHRAAAVPGLAERPLQPLVQDLLR